MALTPDYLIERRRLGQRVSFWRCMTALTVIIALVGVGIYASGGGEFEKRSAHIAKLKISGIITGDEETLRLIREISESRAEAVILSIESPGGTVTGVGEVLKQRKPSVKIVTVEPDASPVLSGGQPGPHKLQGIGAGFVPAVLNTKIYDEVIRVKEADSGPVSKQVNQLDGIPVGISSGASQGTPWRALYRGGADYATAKGGVEAFARHLSLELAEFNITANAVAAGPIETERLRPSFKQMESLEYSPIRETPLHRADEVPIAARTMYWVAKC